MMTLFQDPYESDRRLPEPDSRNGKSGDKAKSLVASLYLRSVTNVTQMHAFTNGERLGKVIYFKPLGRIEPHELALRLANH